MKYEASESARLTTSRPGLKSPVGQLTKQALRSGPQRQLCENEGHSCKTRIQVGYTRACKSTELHSGIVCTTSMQPGHSSLHFGGFGPATENPILTLEGSMRSGAGNRPAGLIMAQLPCLSSEIGCRACFVLTVGMRVTDIAGSRRKEGPRPRTCWLPNQEQARLLLTFLTWRDVENCKHATSWDRWAHSYFNQRNSGCMAAGKFCSSAVQMPRKRASGLHSSSAAMLRTCQRQRARHLQIAS